MTIQPAAPRAVTPVEPGQRYGRLTVIRIIPGSRSGPGRTRRLAECTCACGATTTVRANNLRSGNTRSCGCLQREVRIVNGRAVARAYPPPVEAFVTHGLSGHPLYRTWWSMLRRCENPNARNYPNYGGRGITVCAEWHDPAAFIAWVELNLGARPQGCTLDRIDNDGPYAPGNVRWATWRQQRANRRGAA